MFRAFALALAFFVGMLGCTAPGQPHDAVNSVARATDPAECAINTAPRDTLEQGSGARSVPDRASVGIDDDALFVSAEPFSGAIDLHDARRASDVNASRPRFAHSNTGARGPPRAHA